MEAIKKLIETANGPGMYPYWNKLAVSAHNERLAIEKTIEQKDAQIVDLFDVIRIVLGDAHDAYEMEDNLQDGVLGIIGICQSAMDSAPDDRVLVDREKLQMRIGVILHIFNQGSPGPGQHEQIGEGRLAAILGVDLLTANKIALMYADRLAMPTGHEWFDGWLAALLETQQKERT